MSTSILDVHDSEVLRIGRVMAVLRDRAKSKSLNYNDFEREIKTRFAEIGFAVNVNWYEYSIGGVKQDGAMPEITIMDRTPGSAEFDPDRQVHEVVNNILELPGQEKGEWIKTGARGPRPPGHRH